MPLSNIFFNAHHSPVGAFASFTLGFPGAKGGMGLELGGPANESITIGVESGTGEYYEALPFFTNSENDAKRYDVGADATAAQEEKPLIRPFAPESITREFNLGTDTWKAGDLTFTIYSPVKSVPDPEKGKRSAMMEALVPAVFAEITVDNTKGKRERTLFFAREGSDRRYSTRRLDDVSKGKYVGVGQGTVTAIVSDSPGVYSGQGFGLAACLRPNFRENLAFALGAAGALMAAVPAGKKKTYRFAICFYRDGTVTSGMPTTYYYRRWFDSIESVALYALENFKEQKELALANDKKIAKTKLSEAQKFQLCHAVRSYFGSTEFLEAKEGPFWVVNEGEYRMLNTFDLTVDHLFFEMAQNPWVVRNQLDWFVRRYSYRDNVRLPGDPKEYPGGLSFTHDMGVGNCVSRPSYSSYEQFGLDGCFSHMTHEQLVNWVCCGVTYYLETRDKAWFKQNLKIFQACLTSLVNRDHPDPKQRDGVMSADSSRCLGGAEITTYDSLDVSLGQARNNLYLAVKTWAAYLGLHRVLAGERKGSPARLAKSQAEKCAATIASHLNAEGYIPAVMGEGNESRIIPAIEGLIFPICWGMKSELSEKGEFANLIGALRTHLKTVLVEGTCLFANGAWKLSSTNDNSWLSKIYLSQTVARRVFGYDADPVADTAHQEWLLDPKNSYFAWSDQMVAGHAQGSKYYPRGVTSWLWLSE